MVTIKITHLNQLHLVPNGSIFKYNKEDQRERHLLKYFSLGDGINLEVADDGGSSFITQEVIDENDCFVEIPSHVLLSLFVKGV